MSQVNLGPTGIRSQGFVLAEVLVVAVIVAILAIVAVPVYTGYVRNQRVTVAKNLAQTAAVAANVYYRRTGSSPDSVAQLNLFISDQNKFKVEISGSSIVVTDTSYPSDPVSGSATFR